MTIMLKRFRLRAIWLLTRHPRFRPLYRADVVGFDQLEQAMFLCNAGYYVAATMMARHALEYRVKRLALITPQWKEYVPAAKRDLFNHLVEFLTKHHHISRVVRNRMTADYAYTSQVCHGDNLDILRCVDTLKRIQGTIEGLDLVARRLLKVGEFAKLKVGAIAKGGELCEV